VRVLVARELAEPALQSRTGRAEQLAERDRAPLSSRAGRPRKPPNPPGRNFVPIAAPAPWIVCGERPSGIP
jgi:hypothetical protein